MSNIKPLAPYARDIAYYTSQNNHTEAVCRAIDALSGFDGHLTLVRAIESVRALERFYGHMPTHLIAIRDDIKSRTMKLGDEHFHPKVWQVIKDAF